MIVDHSSRLHVCVHDRATDKLEAALLEVFGERIRLFGCPRNIRVFTKFVLLRFAIHKLPDVIAEPIVFLLYVEKRFCIRYGRIDLLPVSDDARVLKYLFDSLCRKPCNLLDVEIGKVFSVPITFVENG